MLAAADVDLAQVRKDRYRDFAIKFAPEIGRFMKVLTDSSKFPAVFHCHGGKDRTGFAAAAVLLTLGYSRQDAVRDYLTTNIYVYDTLGPEMTRAPSSLIPAFGVHEEQILESLRAIDEQFGSFENYRRDALGLTDEDVAAIVANLID